MSLAGTSAISSLTPDAFLRLFITQLKNQDPSEPLDPSQMIAQLAQLTTVQELNTMGQTFQQAMKTERLGLAKELIGARVQYEDAGHTAEGVVSGAQVSGDEVGVIVNGRFVKLTDIVEVTLSAERQAQGA